MAEDEEWSVPLRSISGLDDVEGEAIGGTEDVVLREAWWER